MRPDQIHNTEATHFVVDFYEIKETHLLDDLEFCENAVVNASLISGCGILNVFKYKFQPQGVSVNATLSESHCAIHTWPERGYCAIDLYGCGDADLSKGVEYFKQQFKPGRAIVKKIKRGTDHETS